MKKRTLAYASYWRNALADATLGQGAFGGNDAKKFTLLSTEEYDLGILNAKTIENLFREQDEQTSLISVIFRPLVYAYSLERGTYRDDGIPAEITPIICFAKLSRSGKLYPTTTPVIPRDVLEPLEAKTYSIGAVDDLDAFLSKEPFNELAFDETIDELSPDNATDRHGVYWRTFKTYCTKLINDVAGDWQSDPVGFVLADHGYILQADGVQGATQHILRLYDHLRRMEPSTPLFSTYAKDTKPCLKACIPPNSLIADRLAHASNEYSLAVAQRDALIHSLACSEGDILAVNGPPGTGKTTLVLSLVVTLWAKAAIKGDAPPVIVATSANNQAASNVIDAFGKSFSEGSGPLAGRWLPEVNSYGAYFPSREVEAKTGDKYQTERFFKHIENKTYLEAAEIFYIEKAQQAFNHSDDWTISNFVDELKKALTHLADKLAKVEPTWKKYAWAQETLFAVLGSEPKATLDQINRKIELSKSTIKTIKQFQIMWKTYLANEPIWYSLFSWLGPVKRKRHRLAQLFVEQHLSQLKLNWDDLEQIEVLVQKSIIEEENRCREYMALLSSHLAVQKEFTSSAESWTTLLNSLGLDTRDPIDLRECDEALDTSIRFTIFRLTVHYWEGRWLQDVRDNLKEIERTNANGLKVSQRRWRRRMMVTPCIVSTLYMLPAQMAVSKTNDGINFDTDYAYNFIDLLLIDEAGLIPPELAGASFSLAKQALVIGDTRQIEPIQSVSPRVDLGNLFHADILTHQHTEKEYERLKEMGKTSSTGSVMKVAQALSQYHYDPDMEKGMYLYEHHRCYDEIIEFCNQLCYGGKLILRRGSAMSKRKLPTMGHLHIDGMCQKASGGSRYNVAEAETIAKWITDHRKELETTYNDSLDKIVCVITPFGNQSRAISQACHRHGIDVGKGEGEMVVGTVHAIQGAERPIVIFSQVYSKHFDGPFIDRSNSMLNVAVSRAKDHFLMFGDMDVFTTHHGSASPRGQLASYLFQSPDNAIDYPALPRRDLVNAKPVTPLHDASEHDEFLIKTINQTQSELHIVTPWIRQQYLSGSSALSAMKEASKRKVSVSVYTDFDLNCEARSHKETLQNRQQLNAVASWLKENGIQLILVKRVHSKIVIADSALLCIGSFNWFSAARQGQYVRHETSLVYRGTLLQKEIEVIKTSLKNRVINLV